MEGRDHRLGNRRSADQFLDALAHLSGSLVGEGDGENRLGHCTDALDQLRNPISDDTRFAAAGTSQNKHGPFGGLDSLTLLRVELGEERQKVNT